NCKNAGSRGRKHVQALPFRHVGVVPVAPRHAEVAENELREERQVETDEDDDRCKTPPRLGIKFAGNLRPPIMNSAEIPQNRTPNHHVVEVCDDEISVVDVNIETQCGKKQPSKAAHSEQANKAEGIKHRG